jgi:hypothetical protein
MEHQNMVYGIITNRQNPQNTIMTFKTSKFDISFEYCYKRDTPYKIYEELLSENIFINKKEFFYYMNIFSNDNSRLISLINNTNRR